MLIDDLKLLDTYYLEKNFLSIIINEQGAIDCVTIKSEWFSNETFSIIFKYIMEEYKENGNVLLNRIYEKHKDISKYINEFTDLYTDCIYFKNKDITKTIEDYEILIIENYKKRIINDLGIKLKNGEIGYKKYVEQIKKLDLILNDGTKEEDVLSINQIDTTDEEIEKVKSNTYMLDKCIGGFALGELSVWSGSNGGAKSTYLNQIALESVNQGYNVLIYSGELTSKRLLKWLISQSSGKHNMRWNNDKGYLYTPNYIKDKIINWLNEKLFIYNNQSGIKANQILKSIRKYIKEKNVKVVFIDNLMSMDLTEYSTNIYEAQSSFVKEISNLAHELNVHIHFVCHPRKSTSFLRKNDISGSADLSNSADNVFILHRVNEDFKKSASEFITEENLRKLEKYTNVVEICKHRESGRVDTYIGMYFDECSKRLLDQEDEIRRYKWEEQND